MKKSLLLLSIFSFSLLAAPILQMNKAFFTLTELMPYILNDNKFKEKKNEEIIRKHLNDFHTEFKLAGHDALLKSDLFAPSYQLMMENLEQSKNAFNKDKKDFALWVLRESVGSCIECHTRLPVAHTSSFQNGDIQIETGKYKDPYELGVTFLIVRRFVDAKAQFQRVIQDKLINKETIGYIRPLQQILLIETKVMKNPEGMILILDSYLDKKIDQKELAELKGWKKRLEIWKNEKALKSGIQNEKELNKLISSRLKPIEDSLYDDIYKPDLLLASGLLSTYFFENPESPSAPLLNLWIGKIEAELRKDEFLNSSDLFLKQCIKKYPLNPIAKKCYEELKGNTEFMFSGSAGTKIPEDVKIELEKLRQLVEGKKK